MLNINGYNSCLMATIKPLRAVLIGAGQRGAEAYAPYALRHPGEIQFVAVAEPIPFRRDAFSRLHHIPQEYQFESWEELLAMPHIGEVALICTQDWQHTQPAIAAMHAGYHVLLEKPMATNEADCRLLVATSELTGRQLHICHVLRYTRHFQKMREVVQSGVLGEIVNVDHRENVSFWHMAHSYVRGNWRNSDLSSPMILAKCCHDLDILPWLLGKKCVRLSSVGSLVHFREENAPSGAPNRCIDGCPVSDGCPYYAPYIYLVRKPFWGSVADTAQGLPRWITSMQMNHPNWIRRLGKVFPVVREVRDYRGWPFTVLAADPTIENIEEALRAGPYGRCVYHCDNNVVDHQVVSMEFEGGVSVTLTMHGHSHTEYRTTRIEGSRGRLMAELGNGGSRIILDDHRSEKREVIDTSADVRSGHGGGDEALMAYFIQSAMDENPRALQDAREALESHLMAFAAERARLERNVIGAERFRL